MAKSSQVDHALDLFGDELARKKNVVGLGKVPAQDGDPGDWDLAVYVERKVPEAELAAADRVPKDVELPGPGAKTKVQTQVIEQGAVSLEEL